MMNFEAQEGKKQGDLSCRKATLATKIFLVEIFIKASGENVAVLPGVKLQGPRKLRVVLLVSL